MIISYLNRGIYDQNLRDKFYISTKSFRTKTPEIKLQVIVIIINTYNVK